MGDDSAPCCGDGIGRETERGTESGIDSERASAQWSPDGDVLEAELSRELQTALGRFLGTDAVETLAEWVDAVRQHTGGALDVEDLCATDEETPHWGSVDGDRYDFACFYDAVILATLLDHPVEIHTESPTGAVVEARTTGVDELTVTPADAVFSFGIDASVAAPPGAEPTLERGYAAICPYVKAFPDRAAYQEWANSVAAPTVALPLAGATELAAALAE